MDSSDLTYRDGIQEFAAETIELVLPSDTGYTLRAYPGTESAGPPRQASFLARDGRLLLFRSPAGLARFLVTETDHDLAGLPGFSARAADLVPAALTAAVREPGDGSVEPAEDQTADQGVREEAVDAIARYEFDLIPANLGGSPDQWIPELLLPARNLTAELADALDLRRVRAALAEGEYLDRFDDALRAAAGASAFSLARRRLRGFESSRLGSQWRQIIRWLEQAVQWAD